MFKDNDLEGITALFLIKGSKSYESARAHAGAQIFTALDPCGQLDARNYGLYHNADATAIIVGDPVKIRKWHGSGGHSLEMFRSAQDRTVINVQRLLQAAQAPILTVDEVEATLLTNQRPITAFITLDT